MRCRCGFDACPDCTPCSPCETGGPCWEHGQHPAVTPEPDLDHIPASWVTG